MEFIIAYIVILGLLTYFLIIRPNKKQRSRQSNLINSINTGDTIETIGGIIGDVVHVNKEDSTIIINSEESTLKLRLGSVKMVLESINAEYEEIEEVIAEETTTEE